MQSGPLLVSLQPSSPLCSAQRQNPAYRTCRAAPEEPTMSANAFVKTELQRSEIEPMPPKDYLLVVDPCESCGFTTRKAGTKPWESCMLQRRYSLRRNEEHPLPTIRRVPINKVSPPLEFQRFPYHIGALMVSWCRDHVFYIGKYACSRTDFLYLFPACCTASLLDLKHKRSVRGNSPLARPKGHRSTLKCDVWAF